MFGLALLSESTIDEVVEHLVAGAAKPGDTWRCVITPNVDHLVRYERQPVERAVAERADLLLPDGMPIIWASKVLKRPLGRRLAGSDLFTQLWRRLAADRTPILSIVGSDEVAAKLSAEHPGAVCIVPPMFDVADDDAFQRLADQVIAAIERAAPDRRLAFVNIGVSMPKHHRLAAVLMDRPAPAGGAPILLLLGASAEFHVGMQQRAPDWMQRSGLEWLHRLAQNPRGMAKRYLVDDMTFVRSVWRERRAGANR